MAWGLLGPVPTNHWIGTRNWFWNLAAGIAAKFIPSWNCSMHPLLCHLLVLHFPPHPTSPTLLALTGHCRSLDVSGKALAFLLMLLLCAARAPLRLLNGSQPILPARQPNRIRLLLLTSIYCKLPWNLLRMEIYLLMQWFQNFF